MDKKDHLFVSLVICTYQRAKSLANLLDSVSVQIRKPDEILIIDGSKDFDTQSMMSKRNNGEYLYFLVDKENTGLTKQRNFGIDKISTNSEIVAFVDDDTILEKDYFEKLERVFIENLEIVGVGGVAINENRWKKIEPETSLNRFKTYQFEDYYINESLRNRVRKLVGLGSPYRSFVMPDFSHVRASGFPLTGNFYEVDLLVGMSFSFRRSIVDQQKFSSFFEGYGLYEDADFSIRAQRFGKNVIHTGIRLSHFHHPSGRPNTFKYGKMVIRNGYYVWRLKYPDPGIAAKIKWHLTAGLLTLLRGLNFITGPNRIDAIKESFGRIVGWFSLWVHGKPKPKYD